MDTKTYNDYVSLLEEHLSEYRVFHSKCVAKSAKRLAEKYGGDPEKAYTAGLLHDIMKEANEIDTFEFCGRYGIELTPLEKCAPKLWHAITGSVYVRSVLGITDPEITVPIRYHTTGRAGMALCEKILFIADFISADRDYGDVDVMREKAEKSLEEAMLYGLCYTIDELAQRRRAIHPDTIAAYNDIILGGKNG